MDWLKIKDAVPCKEPSDTPRKQVKNDVDLTVYTKNERM
jgi:hypothetical protein